MQHGIFPVLSVIFYSVYILDSAHSSCSIKNELEALKFVRVSDCEVFMTAA